MMQKSVIPGTHWSKPVKARLAVKLDWLETRRLVVAVYTWERVSVKNLLIQPRSAVREVAGGNEEKMGECMKSPVGELINCNNSISDRFDRVFVL